jgi:iron complex transport system substrate-binding protein
MRSIGLLMSWVACASIAVLARPQAAATTTNLTRGCVTHFDRHTDYFPDKVDIEDAGNVRVEYRKSYKVVTVENAQTGGPAERYVLVQCGTPPPNNEVADQTITIPISSLFAGSPTHLSSLVDLARLDVLTGVSRLRDLTGDEIARHVATGRVREFAAASVIDTELVVSQRPSMLMTGGASTASLSVIRSAGIPVVANVEWLEHTALARAEWMKFVALFLNEERTARIVYGEMKARYRALSARAKAESTHPLVMTGRSTNGTFVIAGGRSYVAALIADAGGRYVWADNSAVGTASVDLEAQIRRAANADIWINGGGWSNLAHMLQDEPRYAGFKAYRTRQVWVYERHLQASGNNEYWTRSVTHPDVVLADLVKIFHPSLMTNREFAWYMAVPK